MLEELSDALHVQGLRATRLKTSTNARYSFLSTADGTKVQQSHKTVRKAQVMRYVRVNQLVTRACSISGLFQGLSKPRWTRPYTTPEHSNPIVHTGLPILFQCDYFLKNASYLSTPKYVKTCFDFEGWWQDILNPLDLGCCYSTFTVSDFDQASKSARILDLSIKWSDSTFLSLEEVQAAAWIQVHTECRKGPISSFYVKEF